MGRALTRRRVLKFENGAQTAQKRRAILALFVRTNIRLRRISQNALTLEFSLRQDLTELSQALRRIPHYFSHDLFADFQEFAIAVRANSSRTPFTREQRHFAKTITRPHAPETNIGAIP